MGDGEQPAHTRNPPQSFGRMVIRHCGNVRLIFLGNGPITLDRRPDCIVGPNWRVLLFTYLAIILPTLAEVWYLLRAGRGWEGAAILGSCAVAVSLLSACALRDPGIVSLSQHQRHTGPPLPPAGTLLSRVCCLFSSRRHRIPSSDDDPLPPCGSDDEDDDDVMCTRCDAPQPSGASHCPTCDVCFHEQDHHCMFTGICVAKQNYRVFHVWFICLAAHFSLCLALVVGNQHDGSD